MQLPPQAVDPDCSVRKGLLFSLGFRGLEFEDLGRAKDVGFTWRLGVFTHKYCTVSALQRMSFSNIVTSRFMEPSEYL